VDHVENNVNLFLDQNEVTLITSVYIKNSPIFDLSLLLQWSCNIW